MDTSQTRLRKPHPSEDMLDHPSEQRDQLLGQAYDGQSEATINSHGLNKKHPELLGRSIWRVIKTALGCSYANLLLPFVFLGMTAGNRGWDDSIVFVFNFLAILPLAALLSFATEELAKSVGQTLGGLINATFGNAVEMIVSAWIGLCVCVGKLMVTAQVGITAVRQGEINIVQSSMVGSILSGNLLVWVILTL